MASLNKIKAMALGDQEVYVRQTLSFVNLLNLRRMFGTENEEGHSKKSLPLRKMCYHLKKIVTFEHDA
uniref:Uncharacterized protein n=1 Tax=Romanomermis culicivorax TaxID=13658 RepID=A0A915JTS5_ROMCU